MISADDTGNWVLFIFLKHQGFADFQMTIGFSFSPKALTKNATVNRSLIFFPPWQAFLSQPTLFLAMLSTFIHVPYIFGCIPFNNLRQPLLSGFNCFTRDFSRLPTHHHLSDVVLSLPFVQPIIRCFEIGYIQPFCYLFSFINKCRTIWKKYCYALQLSTYVPFI